MTVLRLTHNDTVLDVRPSDVAEIRATDGGPDMIVEVDAGPRSDNYSYLATSAEFVQRTSDTNVPLQ